MFSRLDKSVSSQRFEYEISATDKVAVGDTVWFWCNGAAGVGEVRRAPCLESGYREGKHYRVELTGGFMIWSDEITKTVRPYQTGAWAGA